MALIKWREYTSGQKSATQTNTAPRSAKMFKMWVDVPVMVTNTFREIPLSNIYRTYPGALHEREGECQKAPTYGVLKVDLRKSRFKGNFSTT